MINKDRIVPIQKVDFLSLIGIVLNITSVDYAVLESSDIEGDFIVESADTYLANQPVKSLDFGAVESATVYFVPDYAFDGFKIGGEKVTVEAEIRADGVSLYKAELAEGAVTVTAVSPEV